MVKNKLIILCLLIGQFTFAQVQNNQEIWQTQDNELVMGSGGLLKRISTNNGNNNTFAPALMYKHRIKKNHFLRFAMFANAYNTEKEVPFKIETAATSMELHYNETHVSSVNLNLAYEWQKYAKDNKRLRYTYGLGLMFNSSEERYFINSYEYALDNGTYNLKEPTVESITSLDDNSKKTTSVGGLGYVSLDYILGKRIVVGLQANYFMGLTLDTKKIYANAAFLPTISLLF